jgi:ADP-ribose pyrophosphatase YjhB (NUDIX family)
MQVIYAGEKMPESFSKSIFLAGPTPREGNAQSWRPEALKLLSDKGYDGVVFVPEGRDGKFKHSYDDQVEWEEKHLKLADCILFWVPRDLEKMPAFTTNIEFGVWSESGKVVWGAPPESPKNTYMKYYVEKYNISSAETLSDTLDKAINYLGAGAFRQKGECYVPLLVWKTPAFQSWYHSLREAGNILVDANILYSFRPRYKNFVFLWILKVNVYNFSEDRFKTNEFVLSRPDISSVLMWYPDTTFEESKLVLIKEFRSPVNNKDGFVYELPGGSSKEKVDIKTMAVEEIEEETGFSLNPSRLNFVQSRQLVATLSSHKSHLYTVELSLEELNYFISQKGKTFGIADDTEITYIEVISLKELLESDLSDWSTIGMVMRGIQNKI